MLEKILSGRGIYLLNLNNMCFSYTVYDRDGYLLKKKKKQQQNIKVSWQSFLPDVLLSSNKTLSSYKGLGSVDTLRIMTAAKTEEYKRTGKMCSSIH